MCLDLRLAVADDKHPGQCRAAEVVGDLLEFEDEIGKILELIDAGRFCGCPRKR